MYSPLWTSLPVAMHDDIENTSVQVFQILFESEVCVTNWRHFYDKIVNKYRYEYRAHIWPFYCPWQKEASLIFVAMLIFKRWQQLPIRVIKLPDDS